MEYLNVSNLILSSLEYNHAQISGPDFRAQLKALDIPPRVQRELRALDINTASDLMQWPVERLMRVQHVGKQLAGRIHALVEMA
jgi:hypothetical protein